MINKLAYTLFILLLFVCQCTPVNKTITHGTFYIEGKDFKYSIDINRDSTFTIKLQNMEVIEMCNGQWHYIDKNTIHLLCDSANLSEMISTGYIPEREKYIYVVNSNKIKMDQVVLKRYK